MPLYDYTCNKCGKPVEILSPMEKKPECCGVMVRVYYPLAHLNKYKPPLWVGRMEDIHRAQEQRGERLRMIHPSEVL